MMTRFHHRRVPLLITIGGTGCCGRSTLAALLGEVLNLSHVVSCGAKLMIFDMFLGTFDGVLPIYGRKMGEIGVLWGEFWLFGEMSDKKNWKKKMKKTGGGAKLVACGEFWVVFGHFWWAFRWFLAILT
jgi:ABC-type uncharacterized transport system YnjBCD ATPase subunit